MLRHTWLVLAGAALLLSGCGDGASETQPETRDDGGGPPGARDDAGAGQGDIADAALPACEPCDDCEETVEVTSAYHIDDDELAYTDLPPAGGDHHPCWVPFGAYDNAVPAPRWVHNLEHGGVVFLYHCPEGCEAEVARLTQLAADRPFALVTPYADLPGRFAAVAWGHRLVTDCLDPGQFEAFYAAHADRAPESIAAPPPQSLCAWEDPQ